MTELYSERIEIRMTRQDRDLLELVQKTHGGSLSAVMRCGVRLVARELGLAGETPENNFE